MKKMRLFVSLVSAAVMATSTVLGAAAAHYKGDVDRNDKVTVSDVVTIQKHLSGNSSIAKDKLIYADMNDDGKINVFDLVLAKRVALGTAPKEEVPSLTTPVVTTTVTTTTTTAATTVATTQAETTTTTEAEITQTTTTTTEAETTQTTTTTTEAETTQTTTTTTTEAETTQTTTTTTVATTQAETTTTTAATTQTTTTTTEAETTQTTTTTTETTTTTTEATTMQTETSQIVTETTGSEVVTTGVAGANVNRGALIIYGSNSLSIDRDYYADLTDATGISVPEITGNGTYTARFELSESNIITWLELRLLGANGTYLTSLTYPNLNVTIEGFKADGIETTKALDSVSVNLANWEGASVNLINLLESTTVNESIEVTFTVTGLE